MKPLIAVSMVLLLSSAALAQAPPPPNPPATPDKEVHDPDACANAPATVGKGGGLDVQEDKQNLSEQLADSNGVICPPTDVDPEMDKAAPPGGRMRVIPPPGSPGGNPQVKPK